MNAPIRQYGRGSLDHAAHRLRVAMTWAHYVAVNDYLEDPPHDRVAQRMKRARFAYFERMARTPAGFYVLMDY